MRVEMASMKRDAEHYSRQVSNCISFFFFLLFFPFCMFLSFSLVI